MKAVGPFSLPPAYVLFHRHDLDPATGGRPLRRLPDRTLVPAAEYPKRLAEYLATHPDADDPDAYQSSIISP